MLDISLKPFTPTYFRRRVFGQLWMLALQFLLGMLLNLIGSESTGIEHTIYVTALVIHILNAIGLVEGGLFIALKERSRLAWCTAAAVALTSGSGALTVATGSDVWSFVMASGFLASGWLHVMLYIRADRQVCDAKRQHDA